MEIAACYIRGNRENAAQAKCLEKYIIFFPNKRAMSDLLFGS
jgi:hypothetical protein